jgi:plastocyanin
VAAVTRAIGSATAVPSQDVRIQDFAFQPASLRVTAGTYVVFRNMDAAPHHITGHDFDSGIIRYGAYWSMPFQRAGTFDYICSIHPTMKGQIVVTPPNQAVFTGS